MALTILGLLPMLLGAMVVIGWHTHSKPLIQTLPGLVPMQYNTALGFLMSGAGLIFFRYGQGKACQVAGLIVLFLSGMTLLEYLSGLNMGIDELFMTHYITVETSHPGRMAPNTALSFFLAGISLALSPAIGSTTRRAFIFAVLASLILAMSAMAFYGYLGGFEAAYGWGEMTRMALHTSLGFIMVAAGMIRVAWLESKPDGDILPVWLPVPLVVGAAAILILTEHAFLSVYFWHGEATVVSALVFGSFLAMTVALAQMYQRKATQTLKMNRELELGKKAIERSEERLRAITSAASDAIILIDSDGKVTFWSRSAERIFGFTSDEILGREMADLIIPPEYVEEHKKRLAMFKNSGEGQILNKAMAFKGLHKSGRIFPAELSVSRLHLDGQWHAVGIVRDISDLVAARSQLEKFFEVSVGAMVIASTDGYFKKVNPSFLKMLGYTDEELLSRPFIEFIHPDDRDSTLKEVERQMQKGYTLDFENRYLAKDGDICWLSWKAFADMGTGYVYASAEDVTEKRETESKLRTQAAIIENIAEGVNMVSVQGSVIVHTNPKFNAMFGYEPGELIGKHVSVLNYPDPDKSPELMAKEIDIAILEKGEWDGEIHNIKKDGTGFWTRATVTRYQDSEHGDVMLTVQKDITETRIIEARLKTQAAIIENIAEGVMMVGADNGKIVHTNPNFDRMLGYIPGELVGKHVSTINAPTGGKTPQQTAAELIGALRRQEEWHGEVLNAKKDGTPIWTFSSVNRYRDEEYGDVLLTVKRDITEDKKLHNKVEESEQWHKTLFNNAPDAILLADPETGILLDVNEAGMWLLDKKREDIIGAHHSTIHPPRIGDEIRSLFIRDAKNNSGMPVETLVLRGDGQEIPVEISAHTLMLGGKKVFQGIFRDLSERKKAEEDLAKSELKYRKLVQSIDAAVVVHAPDTSILTVNKTALNLLGITEDQALGRMSMHPEWRFIDEDGAPLPLKRYPVNMAINAQMPIHDIVLGINRPVTKDLVWVLVNAFPVIEEGNIQEVIV
ncbi:MAG: PAS domain S-box protein, partial [Nitrospinota bacterium]|nr:PAS domain S-box protein [Nitrospinota bacterium]